jgi:hypothetical protein
VNSPDDFHQIFPQEWFSTGDVDRPQGPRQFQVFLRRKFIEIADLPDIAHATSEVTLVCDGQRGFSQTVHRDDINDGYIFIVGFCSDRPFGQQVNWERFPSAATIIVAKATSAQPRHREPIERHSS